MKKIIVDKEGFILNPENIAEGIYSVDPSTNIKVGMRVGCPNRLGIFNSELNQEIQDKILLEFKNPEKKEVFYCDKTGKLIPVEVEYIQVLNRVVSKNYFFKPVYNYGYKEKDRLIEIPTEKYIKLTDGKYLINDYGKYQSGLSFIANIPLIEWKKTTPQTFNLPEGNIEVVYGDFFISKKGTKCFEIKDKEKAKHILISDDWGGAFNSYRGRTLPEKGLYYKRARSNGGGVGVDYAIFDKEWKHSLSIEDI